MSEQQRVALVTGAAGGIGRELVLGVLGKGLKVAAVDRIAQGLADLAQAAQEQQNGANLMTSRRTLHATRRSMRSSPKRAAVSGQSTSWSTMPVSARRRCAVTTGSSRSSSGR
jgi:NAD(P)-dependent dehydrogenase (short-subunit alcohol dehydrogenase family)